MIKNEQKEYCANNLASMVISELRNRYPNIRYSKDIKTASFRSGIIINY